MIELYDNIWVINLERVDCPLKHLEVEAVDVNFQAVNFCELSLLNEAVDRNEWIFAAFRVVPPNAKNIIFSKAGLPPDCDLVYFYVVHLVMRQVCAQHGLCRSRLESENPTVWREARKENGEISDIGSNIENAPIALYIVNKPPFRLHLACGIVPSKFIIIRNQLNRTLVRYFYQHFKRAPAPHSLPTHRLHMILADTSSPAVYIRKLRRGKRRVFALVHRLPFRPKLGG